MKFNKINLAILTALSCNAYALDLPKINVIANPLIESTYLDAYSSTSSIVSQDQIRDRNAVDIASALRTTPGVQISRYNPVGGYGGDQGGGVYIRGLGTARPGSEIKTYIDGVPFYSGVWGHSLLDILPVNGMSSITVYKSPQPQINGNNFASINLTTKSATENGTHGDGRLSAGSFGTIIEQASVSSKQDNINFVLSQGFMKSNGHRANADGELKNIMGRLGVDINDHWKADATFLYTDNYANDPNLVRVGDGTYNGSANAVPKYETNAGMLTAAISHKYDSFNGEFRAYATSGKAKWSNYYNYLYKQEFDMNGFKFKENFIPWTGGLISGGVDFDNIYGKSSSSATVINDMPDMRITSPYVAVNQTIAINNEWSLIPSAGVRFYEHNIYSSKTAPHAGLSIASQKATFFANASRGVNYPGQEAVAVLGASSNWRTLSANDMNHYEIGMKLNPIKGTQFDMSIFHDQINSRFAYSYAAGAYKTDGDHTNGAELSLKQNLGDNWLGFVSFTYLDPQSSINLPYMPRSAFVLGLNGNVGLFKVAFDAQHQTKMWANTNNRVVQWGTGIGTTKEVDAFTVANVRVSYPIPQMGKKGEVFVAAENLFDEKYEYAPGYRMPGISGHLGVIASF
jgi:iron complex outermembrane receptor protein